MTIETPKLDTILNEAQSVLSRPAYVQLCMYMDTYKYLVAYIKAKQGYYVEEWDAWDRTMTFLEKKMHEIYPILRPNNRRHSKYNRCVEYIKLLWQ